MRSGDKEVTSAAVCQGPAPRASMGGGGVAQGLGIYLFAFGSAYWPLATAHSDPLGAEHVLVVSMAPG